ncbi:MAG TPA: CoA-binding protein [Rhodospirillales bacterium]|nr:CoA-binding protein [Rhodospirillales bacterium]
MTGAPADPDALLRRAFAESTTIAIVGASSNPARASHYVMAFLQARGWRAIPVNPNEVGRTINGERVYGALADVPVPVQFVDVFRNSAAAGGVVDDAIALQRKLGIRFVWMQLGVRDDAAARRGEAAGLAVIMNRCPKIEVPRLFGAADRETIAQA